LIVCRQCNHSNPNGTAWCQNCNAFLEFEGESQPTQATRLPPAGPAGGPQPPAPPVNPGPPTAATPPPNRGESLVARPGDAPPPPPVDPTTAPRQPGEAPPADATQQMPPTTAPASDIPPIRPGEIVCPVCGWGNEPTRRFCRHDGAVLVPPGGGRGQPPAMRAGQRNRRTGRTSKVLPLALIAFLVPAIVAAAVVGVIYLRPEGNGGGGNGDGTPSPSADPTAADVLVPTGAVKVRKFSSQSGGRVANNLIDGKPETFWSTAFPAGIPKNPKPDIDRRPRLEFAFDPAITLTRIEIINGASGAEFGQRSRAKRIIIQFPDGTDQTFELADTAGEFQPIKIKSPKKISSIVIRISTSYMDGANGNNRFRFSMAEVRFFAKA